MKDIEPLPLAELLLHGAAAHPDRDCIVLPDERVTYGELEARARRAGRALIALGVERGDRVGILMANCLDFVDLLFGASMIGAAKRRLICLRSLKRTRKRCNRLDYVIRSSRARAAA